MREKSRHQKKEIAELQEMKKQYTLTLDKRLKDLIDEQKTKR